MRFSTSQIATLASALLGVAQASSALGSRTTPSVVTKCTEPNTVAITFDDGPYNWTMELVDLLDKYDAKGTFFVNGNNCICDGRITHGWKTAGTFIGPVCFGNPSSDQHWVENHSPPYGEYNDEVVEKAANNGQTVVIWDFDSEDSIGATAEQSKNHYDNILNQHPGHILTLNHETIQTTPQNVIPHALKKIKEKGYKMVTVAQCLGKESYQTVTEPSTRDAPSTSQPRTRQPIRQNLTYQQKIQVLDFYHENKHRLSMESMIPPLRAMGFTTICQSTISRFVKNEAKIRQCAEEQRGHVKRASVVVLPEVEEALVRWIEEQQQSGIWVSGDAIVQRARVICDEQGVPEDERIGFSRGWLDSFKKRNGLNLGRQGGAR
ncbi:unnamed protein product [Rhizoctonia solani]|uniref:HTH CENPB-type domain-containing protein n=1 Tax=Rhizoctonia solani TaxID=456999 RepID=A0A8H3H6Y5_9AGAM|nr:unnamed protein product [Rhizoctonia solani]